MQRRTGKTDDMSQSLPPWLFDGIGRVTSVAAFFESQIANLASELLLADAADGGPPSAQLGVLALLKRSMARQRMEALHDLVAMRELPGEDYEEFRRMFNRFGELNNERNRVVHTFWAQVIEQEGREVAIGFKEVKTRGYEGYRGGLASSEDLIALERSYAELLTSLQEFVARIVRVAQSQG